MVILTGDGVRLWGMAVSGGGEVKVQIMTAMQLFKRTREKREIHSVLLGRNERGALRQRPHKKLKLTEMITCLLSLASVVH